MKKSRYQRVPLDRIRHLLREVNDGTAGSEGLPNGHALTPPAQPAEAANVQKRRAHPKRSIRKEGDDHPVGLWIDKEIFRKHRNPEPQIVLHDPLASVNNRYLALADLVLGTAKRDQRKR